jgi:hypothetical protein
MLKTGIPQNAATPDAPHSPTMALEDTAFSWKFAGSFNSA